MEFGGGREVRWKTVKKEVPIENGYCCLNFIRQANAYRMLISILSPLDNMPSPQYYSSKVDKSGGSTYIARS